MRNTIDRKTSFEIYEFLKTVLVKREDGLVEYKEPWDESSVAKKFKVATSNVAGVRKSFGNLQQGAGGLAGRVQLLEGRVMYLEAKVGEFVRQLNTIRAVLSTRFPGMKFNGE